MQFAYGCKQFLCPNMTRITFSLPAPLRAKIKAAAAAQGRKDSQFIRVLLEQHLSKKRRAK